jgi:acyl carrier protein
MLTGVAAAEIERIVHDHIRAILKDRGGDTPRISGEDKLNATLGLTSLDLATLVAELEVALGVDPFAKLVSITAVRSVDDVVNAYRLAFAPAASAAQDSGLADAVRRAQTRRARAEGGG